MRENLHVRLQCALDRREGCTCAAQIGTGGVAVTPSHNIVKKMIKNGLYRIVKGGKWGS